LDDVRGFDNFLAEQFTGVIKLQLSEASINMESIPANLRPLFAQNLDSFENCFDITFEMFYKDQHHISVSKGFLGHKDELEVTPVETQRKQNVGLTDKKFEVSK
jgi:hypothetical protein